jgi:uncharacterized protein YndB with AHSA1/START domain
VTRVPPVRKEVMVATSPERAFKVFTDGIDRWWPRQHHIGKTPLKREVLEPGVGGRWYGVSEDGSECEIGKVLAWEPPGRLLLTWQITAEWQYDPSFVTEIEVTFAGEGPNQTRVVLEHRELHQYGVAAAQIRKMLDAPEGWGIALRQFAEAAIA